ncbi:MAG: von Willebrand factor type A domain-containing protein, partial [Lentisphaeria bacterium]|nr:von Willebrand factor type A domain-containing protein [Lentisphaeria bacterium]
MNNNEPKIDEILDTMKNRTNPQQDFKSTEQFKADFFAKVKVEEKPEEKKSAPRFMRFVWATAAAVAVCCGLVIAYQQEQTQETQRTGITLTKDTPESVQTIESKQEKTVALAENAVVEDGASEHSLPPEPVVMQYSPPAERKAVMATGFRGGVKAKARVGMNSPAYYSVSDRIPAPSVNFNTEEYKSLTENGFTATTVSPLSTFGADVDTATYTNVRRFLLQQNTLPPKDAVRTEEFLNYFTYNYKAPQGDADFHVNFESMDAPWSPDRKLLLVGVQAKDVETKDLPPSNFVFLIDNSGSMFSVFPMVIDAMNTLADQLRENDRISIVTYGGGVSTLMDGGSGADKEAVKKKISSLCSGGYTPGGAGIVEAYKLAHKHFIKGGNNRIVLITDGDFNVGVSSESELVAMVEKERQSAIYLSAFGVGSGNYKDSKLKMLANKGNGNYFYLDNVREAKRVMTNEMTGKMFTLAKDVKFQIEFNPAKVAAYRLVGYELRKLAARDFNDDTKDAGEVGVGHQVTAVYELVMADAPADVKKKYLGSVDELKYQKKTESTGSGDILTFKLRYQKPEGKDPRRLLTFDLKTRPEATDNIRWAAAVTEFSLLLRNSEHKGNANYK